MKHPILFLAALVGIASCDAQVESRKEAVPAAEPGGGRPGRRSAGRRWSSRDLFRPRPRTACSGRPRLSAWIR